MLSKTTIIYLTTSSAPVLSTISHSSTSDSSFRSPCMSTTIINKYHIFWQNRKQANSQLKLHELPNGGEFSYMYFVFQYRPLKCLTDRQMEPCVKLLSMYVHYNYSILHNRLIWRDRPTKYCIFTKDLTKIPFSFCFAAWSFLLKEIGVFFEDYST